MKLHLFQFDVPWNEWNCIGTISPDSMYADRDRALGSNFLFTCWSKKKPFGETSTKKYPLIWKKKFPHIFGNTEMVPKSFYFERFFSVIVLVLVATMSQQYSSKNKLMIRKYVSLNSQKHEKESFLLFYNNTNYYTKLKTKNPDYMLKWSL